MMKRLVPFAFVLAVTGCATAPPPVEHFDNSRVFKLSKDQVWEKTIEWFATVSMPIKTIEKASGIIAAERVSIGDGGPEYWNCRGPVFSQLRDVSYRMNVFVKEVDGGAKATVNTVVYANYVYGREVWVRQCESTGKYEKSILDSIQTK